MMFQCSPEYIQSLRKVFAGLDRRRAMPNSASLQNTNFKPPLVASWTQDEKKDGPESGGAGCVPEEENVDDDRVRQKMAGKVDNPIAHTQRKCDSRVNSKERDLPPRRDNVDQTAQKIETLNAEKAEESLPDTNWSFDAFLKEQRQQEMQHEAQKERTFNRVLSALGGPAADAADLPPDVRLAWEARNSKLTTATNKAEEIQQQLKVDSG